MCDADFIKYEKAFTEAVTKFGWKRGWYEKHHERDWDCSWTVKGWVNDKDQWLISDCDLTESMVLELIKLADRIKD